MPHLGGIFSSDPGNSGSTSLGPMGPILPADGGGMIIHEPSPEQDSGVSGNSSTGIDSTIDQSSSESTNQSFSDLNMALYEDMWDRAVASAQQQQQFIHNENKLAFEQELAASGSSYQRAVADLKAAGLNPILALMKGGASTPSYNSASGAAASGVSAPYQALQNVQLAKYEKGMELLTSLLSSGLKSLTSLIGDLL